MWRQFHIKCLVYFRKLKIYEEQELTMQVFNEPEQAGLTRRASEEFLPVSDYTSFNLFILFFRLSILLLLFKCTYL